MTIIRGWSLLELLRFRPATSNQPRQFRIMPNQRDYAWQLDDQVSELMEDLQIHLGAAANSTQDERYVLGSIILCPGTNMERPSEVELDALSDYAVIDGQQRLITLIALVSALRSIAAAKHLSHMAEKLNPVLQGVSVVHHEKEMSRAIARVIDGDWADDFSNASAGSEEVSNKSAANFAVVATGLFDQLLTLHEEDSSLVSALADLVVQKTLFAVTLSSNSSNALLAFERANNRGKVLDVSDLLKNYVFMKSERTERLDDATTETIDREWKASRDIVEAKGVNIRFTDLIRWHHRANAATPIDLKGANLYSTVESEISRFSGTGVEYVAGLKQSARWIAGVHRDGQRMPQDEADGLDGLRMIRGNAKMQQHLPVLLASSGFSNTDFVLLARRLEALTLVSVVCKVRSQEVEGIYDEFFRKLKGSKGDAESRIVDSIDTLRRKTSDLSIQRDFAGALSRLRYSKAGEVKIIRYVLTRIDGALESATRGEPLSTWVSLQKIARSDGFTAKPLRDHLDHVHPKGHADSWQGDISEIDTIGNLVLWPERPNTRAGAAPAAKKLKQHYRSSPGNNVRYLVAVGPENYPDHDWAVSIGLRQAKDWSSSEVQMLSAAYAKAMGQILDFETSESA